MISWYQFWNYWSWILLLLISYFVLHKLFIWNYDCYAQLNGNLLCYVNKTMEYYWWGFMIDCTDVKIIYLSLHYIIFMQHWKYCTYNIPLCVPKKEIVGNPSERGISDGMWVLSGYLDQMLLQKEEHVESLLQKKTYIYPYNLK